MERKTRRDWMKFVIFVVLELLVLGMVGSYALSATYDPELVKKAKAEGKLMWYGCVPDNIEPLKAFEKRFGIKTEYVWMNCYPMMERFRTEQRAGRFVADVFYGFTDVMLTLKEEKHLTPYKSPFLTEYDPRFYVKDNLWTAIKPQVYFFTVNTKIVTDKSLWPKKWADYLNPPGAWKDKIGTMDPRSSSATYNVVYSLFSQFGEEKWKTIYKNLNTLNPSFYAGSTGAIQAMVTGEKPFTFFMMNNHIISALRKKAPLIVIVPEDGTTYIITTIGVIKNAPHPNAARLFIDWALDREGAQKVFSEEMDEYALHPAVQPPKGFPKFASLKLWEIDFVKAEAMRENLQKKWAEMMGVSAK